MQMVIRLLGSWGGCRMAKSRVARDVRPNHFNWKNSIFYVIAKVLTIIIKIHYCP